jgi:sorting nexin-29
MKVSSNAAKPRSVQHGVCPAKIYAQDRDCQKMRHKISRLEQHVVGSHLHHHMQRTYAKIKRKKKRDAAKSALEHLLQTASHDPKSFWKLYHPRRSSCPIDDVAKWSSYFQDLLDSCPSPIATNAVQACNPEDIIAAQALNCPISMDEVQQALHKLKSNKSPDYNGIIPELLKCAFLHVKIAPKETCKINFVAHHLLRIFNLLFSRGYFPLEWSMGVLVPVFKKGDPNVMDNYRGITVGSTFAKLFASILENRLHLWAESSGRRAQGQAGFRRGFQTVDNAFILQHMIDAAKATPKGKLYVCFVDFKKAFDSIDRNILLQRLQHLGMHGSMFATLKSMYTHVSCSVRMNGKLGPSFASRAGVKQGCPLSPVLFGLLIDAVEAYFAKHLPGVGVHIAHALVQVLLYADDLALCASSADDLAAMLRVLENFCKEVSMEVNVAKTEVVIFRRDKTIVSTMHPGWHIFGKVLKVSDSFKYLGIHLHSTMGLKFAAKAMHAAGLKAMFALLQRCAALHITNPSVKLKLFQALVRPVLLYGSQLWGVTVSPPKLHSNTSVMLQTWDTDMERLHFTYLRRISGVKKSTHRLVLLREMQSEPLQLDFWNSVLKFWNRMAALPHDRLLSCAFLANYQLAMDGKQCWASKVIDCLRASTSVGDAGFPPGLIDASSIMQTWHHDMFEVPFLCCQGSPRLHASKDVKLCTYSSWFMPQSKHSSHLSLALHPALHFSLMRFRMSSHYLAVEQGRAVCLANRLSRLDRICPLCEKEVEDEMHMCLTCPAYDQLRGKYRALFVDAYPVTDHSMHAFMNQRNQRGIARFIHKALQLRQELIATPIAVRPDMNGTDWHLDDFE